MPRNLRFQDRAQMRPSREGLSATPPSPPQPGSFPTALITFQHATEFSYLLDVLSIALQPESQRHGGRNLPLFRSRPYSQRLEGAER